MPKAGRLLRVFTDESGSPDLFMENKNNFGEKYFSVVSVLIRQTEYLKFKVKIRSLKNKYSKYLLGLEIKSTWIRRSNPKNIDQNQLPPYDFYKYEEGIDLYYQFCNDLKVIIKDTDFEIISVTTNKELANKLYPHLNILLTLLSDLWERIAIYHAINNIKSSSLVFDSLGKLDDQSILDAYDNFFQNGTRYIDQGVLGKLKLKSKIFSLNSESSIGIQLADYCAYPIKKRAEKGTSDFFEEVIKPKLCNLASDRRNGKTISLGRKISLNR